MLRKERERERAKALKREEKFMLRETFPMFGSPQIPQILKLTVDSSSPPAALDHAIIPRFQNLFPFPRSASEHSWLLRNIS
jgi:hypothetical protein